MLSACCVHASLVNSVMSLVHVKFQGRCGRVLACLHTFLRIVFGTFGGPHPVEFWKCAHFSISEAAHPGMCLESTAEKGRRL